MGTIKIEGARLVEGVWHYYKRIPKRLREAFGLPEFKRGTMQTKDPAEASRLARKMLAELDELGAQLDTVASRMRVFHTLTESQQTRLAEDVASGL